MTEYKNQLYINGAWRDASDGGTFDVLNPADESTLATVSSGTVDDALSCLDAAEAAFGPWAAKTPRERGEILRRAFEIFNDRINEIARLITLENGKAGTDAMGEAKYAAEFFRWYAEEAVRAEGYLGYAPASGARILVHQKPAGIAVLDAGALVDQGTHAELLERCDVYRTLARTQLVGSG